MKKSVIFGVFCTLLLSTAAFAQSVTTRDCDKGYLLKNPLVALACTHALSRVFHVPQPFSSPNSHGSCLRIYRQPHRSVVLQCLSCSGNGMSSLSAVRRSICRMRTSCVKV